MSLITWCVVWISENHEVVNLTWPWFCVAVPAGLFLSDWMSGLVHWATDTWFSEVFFCRTISIAREHHIFPGNIVGYGIRDYLGYSSWPTVLIVGPLVLILTLSLEISNGAFFAVIVCTEIALVMVFGTYAHRLGHVRSNSRIIRMLQRCRLLITPAYHAVHHSARHDIRYCVINGWANAVCDRIGFWRGLELLIIRLTGAVPRQNDMEWSQCFKSDPSFMHNPVPALMRLRSAKGNPLAPPSTE